MTGMVMVIVHSARWPTLLGVLVPIVVEAAAGLWSLPYEADDAYVGRGLYMVSLMGEREYEY